MKIETKLTKEEIKEFRKITDMHEGIKNIIATIGRERREFWDKIFKKYGFDANAPGIFHYKTSVLTVEKQTRWDKIKPYVILALMMLLVITAILFMLFCEVCKAPVG